MQNNNERQEETRNQGQIFSEDEEMKQEIAALDKLINSCKERAEYYEDIYYEVRNESNNEVEKAFNVNNYNRETHDIELLKGIKSEYNKNGGFSEEAVRSYSIIKNAVEKREKNFNSIVDYNKLRQETNAKINEMIKNFEAIVADELFRDDERSNNFLNSQIASVDNGISYLVGFKEDLEKDFKEAFTMNNNPNEYIKNMKEEFNSSLKEIKEAVENVSNLVINLSGMDKDIKYYWGKLEQRNGLYTSDNIDEKKINRDRNTIQAHKNNLNASKEILDEIKRRIIDEHKVDYNQIDNLYNDLVELGEKIITYEDIYDMIGEIESKRNDMEANLRVLKNNGLITDEDTKGIIDRITNLYTNYINVLEELVDELNTIEVPDYITTLDEDQEGRFNSIRGEYNKRLPHINELENYIREINMLSDIDKDIDYCLEACEQYDNLFTDISEDETIGEIRQNHIDRIQEFINGIRTYEYGFEEFIRKFPYREIDTMSLETFYKRFKRFGKKLDDYNHSFAEEIKENEKLQAALKESNEIIYNKIDNESIEYDESKDEKDKKQEDNKPKKNVRFFDETGENEIREYETSENEIREYETSEDEIREYETSEDDSSEDYDSEYEANINEGEINEDEINRLIKSCIEMQKIPHFNSNASKYLNRFVAILKRLGDNGEITGKMLQEYNFIKDATIKMSQLFNKGQSSAPGPIEEIGQAAESDITESDQETADSVVSVLSDDSIISLNGLEIMENQTDTTGQGQQETTTVSSNYDLNAASTSDRKGKGKAEEQHEERTKYLGTEKPLKIKGNNLEQEQNQPNTTEQEQTSVVGQITEPIHSSIGTSESDATRSNSVESVSSYGSVISLNGLETMEKQLSVGLNQTTLTEQEQTSVVGQITEQIHSSVGTAENGTTRSNSVVSDSSYYGILNTYTKSEDYDSIISLYAASESFSDSTYSKCSCFAPIKKMVKNNILNMWAKCKQKCFTN